MTTLKQLLPALGIALNAFALGFCLGQLQEMNRTKPSGLYFIGSGKIASPAFSGTNIMHGSWEYPTNNLFNPHFKIVPMPYYFTNENVITPN